MAKYFAPITPGGTTLWELKALTEKAAWSKLIKNSPYSSKEDLEERGYKVELFTQYT